MIEFLLFSLGGTKYCIREEDILAVKDPGNIHRLPSNPSHIAGMSQIESRITALLDLSACVGHSKISENHKDYSIFITGHEKDSVFIIEGKHKSLSIPPYLVFPLPVSLRTSLFDSCVLHDSEPVPVINITKVYDHVRQSEIPLTADFLVPCVKQKKSSPFEGIRAFETGGQQFAVHGKNVKKLVKRPEKLSKPAYIPNPVEGLFFYDGEVMPIINLSRRLNPAESGLRNQMLIAMAGGQSFGFLVDSDRGTLEQTNFEIKSLPPLAQSNWMQEAEVNECEIIPIIDIDVLMSERPDCPDRRPMPERYSPASDFQLRVLRKEVEVVEFSLAGMHHFLPRSEVIDCLKFKPFRRLPGLTPVVLGVTEHAGELLPVLDLSICFGRHFHITQSCSMILVENGDFRALLIAEAMMDERRLSVDVQRELPFAESFNLIYGCFPDDREVKLILNAEALAVHYNNNFSREFFKESSEEPEDTTDDISPALEKPEEETEISCSIKSQDHEEYQLRDTSIEIDQNAAPNINIEEPVSCTESDTDQIRTEPQVRDISEKIEPESESGPETEPETESEPKAESKPEKEDNIPKPEGIVPQKLIDSPDVIVHKNGQEPDTSPAISQQTGSEAAEETPAAIGYTEKILIEHQPVIEKAEDTEPEHNQTEAINEREKDIISCENSEQEEKEEEKKEDKDIDNRQTSEMDEDSAIQEKPELEEIEPDRADESMDETVDSGSGEEDLPAILAIKGRNETVALKRANKSLLFFLFLIFITGAFSFIFKDKISGFLEQRTTTSETIVMQIPPPETHKERDKNRMRNVIQSVPKKMSMKNDRIKTGKHDEPEWKASHLNVTAGPQELHKLDAPPIILPPPDIYEVKNGDNLWRISERLTGSGFNYPNIAKQNNIRNPALIFPDQRIVVTGKDDAKTGISNNTLP